MTSKAWPYEEARKLLKRWPDGKPDGAPILFETGYGPSGLPHIGTFNEVLRTTMVRHAYEELTGAPTRLIAFSDDMDGLRKVPDNVPNPEMLAEHLGRPLTKIPDPFGTHESFAAHNNAMLRRFLDRFGFDYEFASSTDYYEGGKFDEAIRNVLRNWDAILGVMLPTLGEERRKTYSPILPISPTTGRVLQVPVEVVDAEAGMIAFTDEDGSPVEQSALGGRSKLQWKVDWAMRWVALGVDYEMAGKDLIDSHHPVGQDRAHPRRPPARGLQLRDVPRRKRREDLQVEGQWPQPRGMAALRQRGEPRLLHLPRARSAPRACTSASSRARSTNIISSAAIMPPSRSSRSSAIRSTTSTPARCPMRRCR